MAIEDIRLITVGSRTVRVATGGAPHSARTLLVFNGIGASVESLASFMAAFESTRVLTFDVPGVGASPAPRLPYRMREVARLAAGVLDAYGIARADVFGVSWGGAAAQEFAISYGLRCRTLTLAATNAGMVAIPGNVAVLLRLLSPRRYLDPAYLLRVGGKLYGGLLRTERELLRIHGDALRGPSQRGYLYQLLATLGWTSWHRLHRIKAPTLVLMGRDDPIVPPVNGRILAAGLRRATVEMIDCGHLFILTRPREIAQRVERFLADATASAPSTVQRPGHEPGLADPGDLA